MSWVRLDDGFADHPKILQLGPLALAVHVWALCYCARHLTDGFVPNGALRGCPWVSQRSARARAVEALEVAGLWIRVDDGYRIHDYLDFNPDAASVQEKRRQAAERQARWRDRQSKRRNAVTNASSNAVTNASPSPAPKGAGEDGPPNGAAPPPEDTCANCGEYRPLVDDRALYCDTCAKTKAAA